MSQSSWLMRALLMALVAMLMVGSPATSQETMDPNHPAAFEDTGEVEEDSARPFLLAHKDIDTGNDYGVLVKGRNFTVRYSVMNSGNLPAHEVALTDEWPEDNFHVIAGSHDQEWQQIGAGERVETSVTLIAKKHGDFPAGAARVEYMFGDDKDSMQERQMTTATFGTVRILTENQYKRLTNNFWAEWGFFSLLALVPTALPYMMYKSYHASVVAQSKRQ